MVVIGEHIQRLRKENRVTQLDLANAVGVSTQAVSKWERGGTPDAELLPAIADFFHVSIDALYGREQGKKQSLTDFVYDQVKNLPSKERNQEAFRVIAALSNACSDLEGISSVIKNEKMQLLDNMSERFGYQMVTDDTIALMSLTTELPYAIFMPEPQSGYLDQLMPIEKYVDFFKFLSKPHCLEILIQLYQRKNGFTIPMLAKLLNLSEKEITPIIEEMVKQMWICALSIDTDEETMLVYNMQFNVMLLPFLLITMDFNEAIMVGYALVTREKPLLYHNEQKR